MTDPNIASERGPARPFGNSTAPNSMPEVEEVRERVLIVDDEEAILESMNEFISESGYDTRTASSAEKALEILKNHPMDIMITDIMLPGMDGLDLSDRAKRQFGVDVIVMTGYSGKYSYENAIGKGASDFVFKPVRFVELLLRLKRLFRERRLARERDRMMERLKELAITDGLSGLYNSRYFYTQLELEADRSNRYKKSLSLLLMDIDDFKDYNDQYGHLEGDKVISGISKVIRNSLRANDTAYRYGGEEFTVLLPETDLDKAVYVAQRLIKMIREKKFFPLNNHETNLTASIGVTQYKWGESLSQFVQRADKAMYLSKTKGKNRISSIANE